MAITDGTTVETFSGTAGTSHTINLPTYSADDVVEIVIAGNPDGTGTRGTLSLPSGWSWLFTSTETGAASTGELAGIYKAMTGSEGSTLGLTYNNSVMVQSHATPLTGVDTGTPVDATAPSPTASSGSNGSSPAITTVTDDAWVGRAILTDGSASVTAIPSGHTQQGTFRANNPPSNGQNTGVAYEVQATAGNAGTAQWTHGSEEYVAATWAWRPTVGPAITDIDGDDHVDDRQQAALIAGTGFEASQGTGKVELSDNATYGSGNVVELDVNTWSATSISVDIEDTGAAVGGTLGFGTPKYLWVTNDSAERNATGHVVFLNREAAFQMALSSNFAPGGTTAQLTAPSGKTTGDFDGGRIEEALNPSTTDTVIGSDEYREDEWCFDVLDGAEDATYTFRFTYADGVTADTVSVSPSLTISSGTTGTGAQTVPATTQSATGGEEIGGSAAQTVPATSQSATAAETIAGTGSQVRPLFSQSATGLARNVGVGAQSRPTTTQQGTGLETIAAIAAQARTEPQQSAIGAEGIAATAAQNVAGRSQAGTAVETITGVGAQDAPLPSQTTTGIGAPGTTSTAAQARETPSQSGTGAAPYVGTGAQARPAPSQSAIGDAGGPNTGIGDQTVGATSQAGTAAEAMAGTAAQARATPSQSGSAVEAIDSTGAQAAPLPSQTATGIGAQERVGTAAQILPATSQAGTGLMPPAGTAAQVLALASQTATGLQTVTVTASAAQLAPLPSQAGDGVLHPEGLAAQLLAAASQSATASPVYAGIGAQARPAATQSGSGDIAMVAVADQLLPGLSQAGTAIVMPDGVGAQVVPPLSQSAGGQQAEGPGDVVGVSDTGAGVAGSMTGPDCAPSTSGPGVSGDMIGGV